MPRYYFHVILGPVFIHDAFGADLPNEAGARTRTIAQDSAERGFNKLARTFAAQMETLKRYRTGGEQKVTVQHVTVNEGGQAVVGNVSHGGGGRRKRPEPTS